MYGEWRDGKGQSGSDTRRECRKAVRYDSMVETESPSDPKQAANKMADSAVTGVAGSVNALVKETKRFQAAL